MTFNPASGDPAAQEGQPNQDANSQDQGQGTGEGVDLKTFQELQKRDEHAQQHISHLEGENNGMREEMKRISEEMQALKDKLAAQQKVEDLLKGNQTSVPASTETKQDVNPVDVDKLVSERVSQFFTEKEQQDNFNTASKTLATMFSDKADEHVTKIAQENGMNMDDAVALSRTNPKMFNNIFIKPYEGQRAQSPAPSHTGQNTGSVPTGQPQITQEYWSNMRRDPKTRDKFWSVPVQKEYHKWVASQNKSN